MWIQCLIERDGDTEMRLALSCYRFKKNDKGHAVCNVLNGQHSDYLLGLKGDFREYKEEKEEQIVETIVEDKKVELPTSDNVSLDDKIKNLWESGERDFKVIAKAVGSLPVTVSQKIRKMRL